MSSINSVTFNAGSSGSDGIYDQGDSIVATVDYTADTPALVATPFTLNTSITDASGNVTATNASTFTVNEAQANPDTVQASDSGNRTWTEGAQTVNSDGSLSVPFSATA